MKRYCTDCKHSFKNERTTGDIVFCRHPDCRDVTGISEWASTARACGGECGPDAKLYEAKDVAIGCYDQFGPCQP